MQQCQGQEGKSWGVVVQQKKQQYPAAWRRSNSYINGEGNERETRLERQHSTALGSDSHLSKKNNEKKRNVYGDGGC